MKIRFLVPLLVSCGFASHAIAANIVMLDVARVSGSTAIDPPSRVTLNATGSTSQTTLEGLPDFAAIQLFSGFTGNVTTANNYIFDFTNTTLPDIKLTYSGATTTGAVAFNNSSFQTSDSSAMRVGSSTSSSTSGFTLNLGSYNSGTDTFTNVTSGGGVSALGFTLSGRFASLNSNLSVTYFDAAGGTLSTQLFSNAADSFGYTGFQSTGAPVGSVSFSYTGNGGINVPLFGFDDLGFTNAVPEPTSCALLIGGLLGLGFFRRHRCA